MGMGRRLVVKPFQEYRYFLLLVLDERHGGIRL